MRMKRLSVRISGSLLKELRRKARKAEMGFSEFIRYSLVNAVAPVPKEWLLIIWKIFGVNLIKTERALSKSMSVAEFLSHLDDCSKIVTITPNVSTNHDYDFNVGGRIYNVSMAETNNVIADARAIIIDLDEQIIRSFEEAL